MSSEPLLSYSPSPLPEKAPEAAPRRLASIDAYRGLVMFLMMAEVLRFCAVAGALPKSAPIDRSGSCFASTSRTWNGLAACCTT